MATYSLLWLPVVYYGLPVVYYGYTYSLPSVLSSLLQTATLLYQPSLHYNRLCADLSALSS